MSTPATTDLIRHLEADLGASMEELRRRRARQISETSGGLGYGNEPGYTNHISEEEAYARHPIVKQMEGDSLSLDLSGLDLRNLPPSIGQLISLQHLNVSGNDLEELPTELAQLRKLETLTANGNHLRRLPSQPFARKVEAFANDITDFPTMKNVEYLDLTDNRIAHIRDLTTDLPNIQTLLLMKNDIRIVPRHLLNLGRLQRLSVGNNPTEDPPAHVCGNGLASIRKWYAGKAIKAHIFISYVREDVEVVTRLASTLKDAGHEVWIDSDALNPGDDWRTSIRRAIASGSYFFACFSENSINKHKSVMNEEIGIALEQMRQMPDDAVWFVPVRLSNCSLPQFEIRSGKSIDSKQWVDLHSDWDAGVARILARLGR
jgi:hypothetical protein